EIELLVAWADGRTPRGTDGDPAAASPPSTAPAVTASVPQGAPARGRERLEVPLALDGDRSIVEWRFAPADGAIRRAVFSIDGVRLGAWVPSRGATTLPDGVSVAAREDSRLAMDVEYVKSRSASGGGGTLTLTFGAPGAPPSHLSFGCGAHAIARSVRAFAITPLARGAGDSIEVAARYRDGSGGPLSAGRRASIPGGLVCPPLAGPALPAGVSADLRVQDAGAPAARNDPRRAIVGARLQRQTRCHRALDTRCRSARARALDGHCRPARATERTVNAAVATRPRRWN